MLFCVFCGVRSCSFCDVKQVRSRIFVFFGDMCKRGVITGKGKKEKVFSSLCHFLVVREGFSQYWPSSAQSSHQLDIGVLEGGSLT